MSGQAPPGEPEREPAGIQVDAYALRTSLRPSPPSDPDPQSWRQAAQRINSFLMGISVGVFGLVHDTVAGARALVRGVTRFPEHLNRGC